jgi:hypothetical protein
MVIDRHGGEDVEVVEEQKGKAPGDEAEHRRPVISVPARLVRQEEERLRNDAQSPKALQARATALENVVANLLAQAGQKTVELKLLRPRAGSRAMEMSEEERERDRLCRKERRDHDTESESKAWVQGRTVSRLFVVFSVISCS